MNDKVKLAVIVGAVIGLLSAIPFVNLPNACCCLYFVAGGLFATYTYAKRANGINIGDGAMLGLIVGAVGALVYLIVGIPLNYMAGNAFASSMTGILANLDPAQAEVMREQIARQGQSLVGAYLTGFIVSILMAVFSIIGGLIGAAVFGRNGGANTLPPPPPTFSETPGGGFGSNQPGSNQPGGFSGNQPGGYGNPPAGGGFGNPPSSGV